MFLVTKTFENIVTHRPICALDLCILNEKNELLLGKRKNPPAKGYFFVPGGRLRKGETLNLATNRLLKSELNYELPEKNFEKIKLLGAFEHFYDENFLGNKSFSSHYLIIAYSISLRFLNKKCTDSFNDQHEKYLWYNNKLEKDIKIHPYVNKYLKKIKL